MKRLFISLFALLPLWVMAQEKIMVIADPHVLAKSLIEEGDAFDSMMVKQRKMIDLSEPIWNALMDTAMKYKPELVLIPGDLTKDSEKASHAIVVNGLQRLEAAGIKTLVIPGNHDIGGNAKAYRGVVEEETESLKNTEWESTYSWIYEHAVATDANSHSFASEPLTGVTVIGIDGSDNNAGTGVLKPGTLEFVLAQADSAASQGRTIIAMAHWQVLEHFDMQGTLESACRFQNADALRDSLMAHGVHLVLTGHFHINSISTFRDTTGVTNDSIVEISSGSPITYPCPYRWLTLSQDKATIRVETEYLTSVDTIADLYTYSRAWMAEHTHNMVPTLALRAWGKVDEKWDSAVVPAMTAAGFNTTTINGIKSTLPQTDEDRIAITERNLGKQAVSLYLFHSDGNENENPERGRILADSVYNGMQNMVKESLGGYAILLGSVFSSMAVEMAKIPVESMIEDKTNWSSENYGDVTNDLRLSLTINAPQFEGVEQIEEAQEPIKFIRDGQFFIRRGEKLFNANGQEIAQ